MTDETAAGGNAAENIIKKNSKVNVSHRYRTEISKNVLKERNLKHYQGHKRYSSWVRAFSKAKEITVILKVFHQNSWADF